MRGLISDRFLKRFFRNYPEKQKVTQDGKDGIATEYNVEQNKKPDCLSSEDKQKLEPVQESKN